MNSHRYSFYLAPSSRPKAVRFRDRSGFPPVRLPAAHSQRAPAYARAVAARWCGVCRAVRCALDCAPSRIRACASACNKPAMHPQPAGRTHLRGFALALTALLLSVRPALGRCARGSTRALRARPQSRPALRPPGADMPASPALVVHHQRLGDGGMRRCQAGAQQLPRVGFVAGMLRCVANACVTC